MICHDRTMVRVQLSEQQWSKNDAFLRSERAAGRPAYDDRRFVEAVLWWRRTGVPWRDLPSDFGPWKTVFSRFDRWAKAGKWERLFLALQTDRDDEWHSLDSTISRAHQHASGGKKGAAAQGIGRSRAGLSTKVHLVVDALGLPLIFEITEGQRHDTQPAKELLSQAGCRCLLADKAYDSDDLRDALTAQGAAAVIPSKASRAQRLPLRQGAVQSPLRNRVHIQPAQAGSPFCDAVREDSAQLRGCGRTRLRACVAKNLKAYSSRLCASLISMDTTRTSISLPVLCPCSSSRPRRESTSSRAADSVADPRADR